MDHAQLKDRGTITTEYQNNVSSFYGEDVVETVTDSYSNTPAKKSAVVIFSAVHT